LKPGPAEEVCVCLELASEEKARLYRVIIQPNLLVPMWIPLRQKPYLTLILTAWEFKKPHKILTNFFVSEVFIKSDIFSMLLMIIYVGVVVALFSHKQWLWLWL
jgi:hypothetical protein